MTTSLDLDPRLTSRPHPHPEEGLRVAAAMDDALGITALRRYGIIFDLPPQADFNDFKNGISRQQPTVAETPNSSVR